MEISVVIPTLNEADGIADVVKRTRELGECEVIVVDGGSEDETLSRARTVADHALLAPRGRALQQNAGAAAASGEILLFLHADCWLEPGSLEEIRSAMQADERPGGCFRQRIDATGMRYRLLEWGNAARVRLCGWAYGDQGIFVRRDVFERIGGFAEVRLMEDLLLSKRLKREGGLQLLGARLHVSPRRWQKNGIVRQTLRNWALLTLAHCGVSPDTLARHYVDVR
ncbi:N-glycosyltransferase [Maioricimonas rarisocia]|uniref:N-glycosyltransferase n=1 Tax=Maioricimonas rarisocia TaxID=2528026 RepID=A0A517Z9G0_9PLAN|nr:TIGR04283 family arsenosugar biosynthesis glycosyltransferase [Maioricimonas rarisocia]QDU39125.1 N-glycosyltransferase [Maioricimonas rarisocia]